NLYKAEELIKAALSIEPDNTSFHDTYAWIVFETGRYEEAQEWIKKALAGSEIRPAFAEHYGDILYMLGKTTQALEQWERARALGDKSERLKKKINEKKYME